MIIIKKPIFAGGWGLTMYTIEEIKLVEFWENIKKIKQFERKFLNAQTNASIDILMNLVLNNGKLELSVIYQISKSSPANIRLHLKRLLDKNIIKIEINEKDKRERTIFLTQNGISIVEEFTNL